MAIEHNRKHMPVLLNGVFYENLTEALRTLDLSYNSIRNTRKALYENNGFLQFDGNVLEIPEEILKFNKPADESYIYEFESYPYQIEYNGKVYNSLSEFSKELKISINSIIYAINTGTYKIKGRLFKVLGRSEVAKNAKKVQCIETDEIFDSLSIAADMYMVSPSNICSACNGRIKTSAGLHWRYV